MRPNDVLGVIFSNTHDSLIHELTEVRAIGSVPFGGRYRLIDFSLSNLVNAGISKVGVITRSNYQSLMDHLSGGKSWDLARKKDGLFVLPPYGSTENGSPLKNLIVTFIFSVTKFTASSTRLWLRGICSKVSASMK